MIDWGDGHDLKTRRVREAAVHSLCSRWACVNHDRLHHQLCEVSAVSGVMSARPGP
jgi:hypothetical protein